MNERELFKKWLKAFDNGAVKIDRVTEIYMWQAWLASKNREGYKLVPVETLGVALSWAEFSLDESWSCEQHVEINKHTDIINKAMTGVSNNE